MSINLDRGSAKILVLGDSGVGKSSLIHLICHSSVLSSAQWTIGCSMDVKLHDNYFLEFWDIGGSRSHKIARAFLYQDYYGVILVFDATNSKSRLNLNEWLAEATQKTSDKDLEACTNIDVPIITIATKKDLLPQGSVVETSKSFRAGYYNEHCSVVNFNESPQMNNANNVTRTTGYLSRRNQSSSMISSLLPSHPSARHNSPSSSAFNLSDPSSDNQVIYVNTQDVLSFGLSSKNYEMLNNFFKHVIDRRNKKVYNKFAI